MKKNKIGIAIIALLLIMNYTTVIFAEELEPTADPNTNPVEFIQDSEVQIPDTFMELENQSITPAAVGNTIAQTFPDPKLAQVVANEVNGGDVNDILTQAMVDDFVLLSANFRGITDITGIGTLTNLKEVHLARNQISSIPAEINNLTSLEYLDLSENKLTSLSSEIGTLTKLETLYVSWNQLTSLPPEIGNLTALRKLYGGVNQLTTIPPEIGNLSSLEYMGLSLNKLNSLPPEIGNLSQLVVLRIESNQLTTLPAEIGNMNSLTELRVNYNLLQELPVEIGSMGSLEFLDLVNNQLKSLPSEIGNIVTLKYLFAAENQLESLPKEIGNLINLEQIYVASNQLTTFPTEVGALSSLKFCTLNDNMLTNLPTEIGNWTALEVLDVSNNQLTSLPNEIGNIPNLYQMHFAGNLLPSDYPDVLNTLGFYFPVAYEDQRQLVLKTGIEPYQIQSESDLNEIVLPGLVELSDATPISPSHHFILTNYVDENGQPVALETYLKNGVVQKNGKVYAQVRSTGTGLFPNNSEHAITLDSIELDFQANFYTLSFDLNGATGALPEAQSLLEGDLSKAPNHPTRDGYTFKGWNTAADGSGSLWDFETTIMPANNVTLYAQWQKNMEPPVNPTDPNLSGNETPKTGDSSNILWLSVLMILAGVTLMGMHRIKKYHNSY